MPAYLYGRFGPKPQAVVLAAADGRSFEPGCLIYPNSDADSPLAAIGAVIGPAPDAAQGARAVVNRAALSANPSLFVRDTGGPVPVTLVEKAKAPVAAGPV